MRMFRCGRVVRYAIATTCWQEREAEVRVMLRCGGKGREGKGGRDYAMI